MPSSASTVGLLVTGTLLSCLLTGCGGGGGSSSTPPTPAPTDFTLAVGLSGNGSVTSSPAGIACGNTCTASFAQGSQVTLSATPDSSDVFSGWGGACANSGSTATCSVTMSQYQSVSATFSVQTTPSAKPTLNGLVTMGSENWLSLGALPQNRLLEANAHPGVYVAAVIEATWSQLEPQPGVFDDNVIDAALQNIVAYNEKYPATPLVGKLRIFAGPNTPAWVLQQVGSVTLTDAAGNSAVFPAYWTSQYSVLWTQLQNHLAAIYDSNPLMGEVAITACSSIDAEPFITGFAANTTTLLAAGYTDAQMEQCLGNAVQDYAAWKQTPLDFTFNPLYLRTTASQPQGDSSTFTLQVMQAFRTALGTRAVEATHSLNDPLPNADQQPVYDEFQSLYSAAQSTSPPTQSPLEFQTSGPTVDWAVVIPFGIDTYHPSEIEIWNTTATGQGGLAPVTLTELQQWAAEIKQP